MRKRLLLPLLTVLALLAVPAVASAYLVGVADESWKMFLNTYYTRLIAKQPASQRISRYIAPYDAADGERKNTAFLNDFTAWYNQAVKSHVQMLVSFYHSEQPKKAVQMPSVSTYETDIEKFMKRYPLVTAWQPWDEANRGYIPHAEQSPTALQSAEYYKVMRKVCPKVSKHCTIVGLDVLDQPNVTPTLQYINAFKADLRRTQRPSRSLSLGPVPYPDLWGLHNYSDTNRFSTSRTRAILADVPGDVWLTETGGLVQFGSDFPNKNGSGDTRAAKALTFMFRLASISKRITRLYIFDFYGASSKARFDAGLLDANGTPRPGYVVVCKQLHASKCSGFKIDTKH